MASRALDDVGILPVANDRAPVPSREWFTAAELADLRLPGLPSAKRALNRRINAEGWAYRRNATTGEPLARTRSGQGGGFEYHIGGLPASAQVELVRRGVAGTPPEAKPQHVRLGSWSWYERQSGKVKAEATRRLNILAEIETMVGAGMTRSAAIAAVIGEHAISSATLWNWRKLIKGVARADWEPALAPRREGGGADADVDAHVWKMFLSDYLRAECPTLSSCYHRAVEVAEAEGRIIPSEQTMRRKLKRELARGYIDYKRGGVEVVRRSVPAERRTVDHLHALQIVNIDGHKFDLNVKSPIDGKPCRPIVVTIQDIYSSKILAWCADVSENAIQTQIAFGNLFREYGIPNVALMDNGRGFAAKSISGGQPTRFRFKIMPNEPTGVLTALDINVAWALPYRGQSKPIERAFRDIADHVSRHPAAAGAYTGNSVANKPHNFGARVMEWDEFIALVTKGFASHNARKGRRGRHYAGRSFDQVFAESYAVAPITKATPEHLRKALLTAERKRIAKQDAAIELYGNRYWADELREYAGQEVLVRFDPEDLHRSVFIYSVEGHFLVEAENIANSGFDSKASAAITQKRWKGVLKKRREADEALALFNGREVAERLPDPIVAPVPEANVVRMRRHRGQVVAALKVEPAETPHHTKRVLGALRVVE